MIAGSTMPEITIDKTKKSAEMTRAMRTSRSPKVDRDHQAHKDK